MAINIRSVFLAGNYIQCGNGIPNHISPKGSNYIDLDAPKEYLSNGDGSWLVVGTGGSSGTSSGTSVTVTGFTYNNANKFTIFDSTGGTFNVIANTFTGITVNGSLSATTYQNLPTDIRVTGGTYSNSTGISTFTNNTGGTFSVSGFTTGTTNTFTTGLTFNNSTFILTGNRNDGGSYTANLSILSSDVTITGGTYNNNTGIATFTNNSGATFQVSGFTTGLTDTTISSFTYNNANKFTLTDTTGGTFNVIANIFTGLTSTGVISTSTLSATTYQNLPIDIRVTGGTYNNGSLTFTNNTGGTFNISGFFTGSTDIYVTGGTPNNSTKTYTFTNSTGGTFVVTGLTDISITGGTYSNGTTTLTNNTGGTITINGYVVVDTFVTGGTPNNNIKTYTFTNSTGGTFSVVGLTDISITGITNSNNVISLTNNTGGTISTLFNTLTGLTVNGILSATTENVGTENVTSLNATGGTINSLTATTLIVTSAITYTDGNQAPGKILTTIDSSGKATWQYPANSGTLTYYFTTDASDIATYDVMYQIPQTQTLQLTTIAGVVSGNTLINFVTLSGTPNLAFIPGGVVTIYIDAAVTAGTRTCFLYCDLFKRTTGGTETLINTGGFSSPSITLTNIRASQTMDMTIQAFTANTSDRLVLRIYGGTTGGGSAPTIVLYTADATGSRIELPASAVNISNFVPYTGATIDVNLNNHNLSNINNLNLNSGLSASTISATTYSNIKSSISATFDGQGGVLTTGSTAYITMTNSGNFKGWYILSPISGNLIIDVWKAAGAIPTIANSIAGTNKPTLTSQTVNSNTNLAAWTTTTFAIGDIVALQINSASTVTYANVVLQTTKE